MANITNHFESGSCIFQAGSTMNGDVHITGSTFYQGKSQEKTEEEEEKKEKEKGEQLASKESKSSQLSPTSMASLGKQKPFFLKTDNTKEENKEVRQRERDRFLRYLSLHNMGNRTLTTQQDDTLNSIVASFLIVWREKGWIARNISARAAWRFLHDDCGLKSDSTQQSYANKIKEWVDGKKYSPDVLAEVEEYMKA